MKKIIASFITGGTALGLLAQSLQSTNKIPVESHTKPLATLIAKGANMTVIQTQLFAITNSVGKPIMDSLNPTNINYIDIHFVKTNGVPEHATVLVPGESHAKPLVALLITGTNMTAIQTQLFTITNSAGKSIMGNLNPTNINYINIYFVKTNGVPERVTVLVR